MAVGTEVDEQLVDLVEDPGGPASERSILLMATITGKRTGHRLLEDVACLGKRALRGVDEKQHRVDHQQAALDLAAVGVAGRADDVQADHRDRRSSAWRGS